MGPQKCIGSILQHQEWAHAGPHKCIGSIFQHQEWAHISVLAAFLRRSGGPFHCHWQYFYPSEWAHTKESVVSLTRHSGPTQVYQQYFSARRVGPHKCISSISQEKWWAHSLPLAVFSSIRMGSYKGVGRRHSGPIHDHWQ